MHRLVHVFLYGFFAACVALIGELILFGILPGSFFTFLTIPPASSLTAQLVAGLFFFALLEESSRFLFLARFTKNFSPSFSWTASLSLGGVFGLGFAGLEVLLGFLGATASLSPSGTGGFFLHIFASMAMAFFILHDRSRKVSLSVLFGFVLALHLFYNIFVFLS